jgi:DNA-binding transcriptional LysR family regulator
MTLHQLKIWTTVAKHRSMTRAADELRIRQPSVTQQIKLLEREYRLNLYTVNGRGIELTPAGRILLKYAKKTLLLVDNLEKEIRSSVKRRRRHR